MRRSLSLLATAAVLAGSFGFAGVEDVEDVIVCVNFSDVVVPGTTIRVERPTERVCVKTPRPYSPLGDR